MRRLPAYLLASCCAFPVWASEERLIEEIIVMAQRVEEDLQKVPIAVSAFTDTAIDDRQIVGLEDLQ